MFKTEIDKTLGKTVFYQNTVGVNGDDREKID